MAALICFLPPPFMVFGGDRPVNTYSSFILKDLDGTMARLLCLLSMAALRSESPLIPRLDNIIWIGSFSRRQRWVQGSWRSRISSPILVREDDEDSHTLQDVYLRLSPSEQAGPFANGSTVV